MRIERSLVMPHDIVTIPIVAASRGVRHIGDREELVVDAEFLQVGGELQVELVVETLRAIPNQNAQGRPIFARRESLREIPRIVADRQKTKRG